MGIRNKQREDPSSKGEGSRRIIMQDEIVKIKGGKRGLQLSFAENASFEDIWTHIEEKLESGSGFFLRGTLVLVPRERFLHEELEKLQKLFHAHGLICRPTTRQDAQSAPVVETKAGQHKTAAGQKPSEQVQEMVVVNRTLRGGQEICTDSSVLVCGNVNPGAQIIAGGSIDLRGTCRGLVHAGAAGDTSSFIIADHLMPTQIRIANLIARSPDHMEMTERAERASIKDGQIVIEPIER